MKELDLNEISFNNENGDNNIIKSNNNEKNSDLLNGIL